MFVGGKGDRRRFGVEVLTICTFLYFIIIFIETYTLKKGEVTVLLPPMSFPWRGEGRGERQV